MTKCAVLFCKNYSNRTKNISYHAFPIHPFLKIKWVEAASRDPSWIPTKHNKICSIHFEPEYFNENAKKMKHLHKGAIPTLHLPHLKMPSVSSVNADKVTTEQNLSGQSSKPAVKKYTPREQRLKWKVIEQNEKIRKLAHHNSYLKQKVASLTELLDNLTEKSSKNIECHTRNGY